MSTRGLIIIKGSIEEKEDKTAIAVYNHYDSYPSVLGKKLRDMLWELWEPRHSHNIDYVLAKRELAKRFLDWNKVRYAGVPEDEWKWCVTSNKCKIYSLSVDSSPISLSLVG